MTTLWAAPPGYGTMITSAVDSFTDTYQDTSSEMGNEIWLKNNIIAHEGNESEIDWPEQKHCEILREINWTELNY